MVHEELIETLLIAMINSGVSEEVLVSSCQTARPELSLEDIRETVKESRIRLTRAADYSRDEEFARAKRRCEEIYNNAYREGRMREALAAQKELNRLMDLNKRETESGGSSESAELQRIRSYFSPLGWGDNLPVWELARLAVQKIVDLQAEIGFAETQ